MVLTVTWRQALAWRLERQYLHPMPAVGVEDVVRRLCGVQAQVGSSAEHAIRARLAKSSAGEVARALSDGRLIKTWAMRGTLHLLTPQDAGDYLALLAAGRSWERSSWEKYFGISARQMHELRYVVGDALADGPLTREELIVAVTRRRSNRDRAAAAEAAQTGPRDVH